MIGMTLRAAKEGFFDREKVKRSMSARTREVFSRFGAFVRQRAKTSIDDRKAISLPGRPPSSHTGRLRKLIYFAYEARQKSVVIGPKLWKEGSRAPALLEFGGTAVIMQRQKPVRARYRPRPYMRPAFREELKQLPALWRESVR